MDSEKIALNDYKLINDLWMSENSIKTNKLQVLLATNSILVSAFFIANHPVWIALVGSVFSMVWVLSIGRTVSYQERWQSLLEGIERQYPSAHVFQIHSEKPKAAIWGRVPSKYYLLGTPIGAAVCWLIVFIIYAI
ncbi:MAG: hypothetical protein ABSA75_14205 [Candidatus Bathyarchaeia archaeon]|jgi:hypothetical protein